MVEAYDDNGKALTDEDGQPVLRAEESYRTWHVAPGDSVPAALAAQTAQATAEGDMLEQAHRCDTDPDTGLQLWAALLIPIE
jgi:hypothetical protein